MKKILMIGAAIVASTSMTGAMASTHNSTPGNAYGPGGTNAWWAGNSATGIPDDTTPATPTTQGAFSFSGAVAKDCTYNGSTTGSATNAIPLGAIGVNNGTNVAVANLFNQAAQFTYEIGSTAAGCNFNNTVTVTKSAQGLVNSAAGGYDTNTFVANIPYSVVAGFTGSTSQSTPGAGAYLAINMSTTDATKSQTMGAWRSNLNMTATFPAQTKGLVAGNYTDTLTVVLAVDTGA